MHFGSDNVVGASPKVMDALVAANSGAMSSYGEDALAQAVEKQFSDIFEKDVSVFLMSTGTAANGLALACITPAWGEVFWRQDCAFRSGSGPFSAAPRYSLGKASVTVPDQSDGMRHTLHTR
jgi:Beta-eliminating lyase